jgi:hypothetical protein
MAYQYEDMRRFFRRLSGWVWNEQGHAFDHGLSLQEETLTEMLLLQIAKRGVKQGLKVKMFSRAEESANGADWEWFFKDRSCSVGFRVQAKRLYRSDASEGRYGGLDKTSSQTENLIKQAGANNPIYVFYNHDRIRNAGRFHRRHGSGFKPPSYWGCAIAKASFVKAAPDNKLTTLHSGMRPWHTLFDPSSDCPLKEAFDAMPGEGEFQLAKRSPEWAEFFAEPSSLDGYLDEHDLKGVAFFDASDFRFSERAGED